MWHRSMIEYSSQALSIGEQASNRSSEDSARIGHLLGKLASLLAMAIEMPFVGQTLMNDTVELHMNMEDTARISSVFPPNRA